MSYNWFKLWRHTNPFCLLRTLTCINITVSYFTVYGEQLRMSPFSNWNATFENIGRIWILIVSLNTLFHLLFSLALFSCFNWVVQLYVIESNPVGTSAYLDYFLPSSLCKLGIYPFYPSFSIQHGSKRSLRRQSMWDSDASDWVILLQPHDILELFTLGYRVVK